MGLLDEAIREHLELKRRSGADPTTVERAEQEALAPVFPDEDVAADPAADGDERLASLQALAQDTAELDMQAVMEEDRDVADPASQEGASGQERLSFE
jgi:hypothetical protein